MNDDISNFDQDFLGDEVTAITEAAETPQQEAELITDLAFRVLVEKNYRFDPTYKAKEFLFIPTIHGELYSLPNYEHDYINPLSSTYYMGKTMGNGSRQMPAYQIGGYITNDGVPFVKIEQQYMVESPLKKNGVFLATISECAVLIAKNEADLFIAHIGYSEVGNTKQVIEFFKSRMISTENIYAIYMNPHHAVTVDWHRAVKKDDLLEEGLKEDHIIVKKSKVVAGNNPHVDPYGYDGIVQVTASSDFITLRTFGYRMVGRTVEQLTVNDDIEYIKF